MDGEWILKSGDGVFDSRTRDGDRDRKLKGRSGKHCGSNFIIGGQSKNWSIIAKKTGK
jgi:hypothetical protein